VGVVGLVALAILGHRRMQLKVSISQYQNSGTGGGRRDWHKEHRMKTVENWSFGGNVKEKK
jgi:hypothetical protein